MKDFLFYLRSRFKSDRKTELISAWLGLRMKKFFLEGFKDGEEKSFKIDVVIPTVPKDTILLKRVVESVRKNLLHEINKIYIVSPKNDDVIEFCQKNNYLFINETDVLGYSKERINYSADGWDLRGWLFQQLLKLSGEKFVEMENYLAVDSDTLFIRPHRFMKNNKYIFLQNEEWNEPYFQTFKKIFGYDAPTSLSYTSHMMIFNSAKLKEMKAEIERKHAKGWDDVYISTAEVGKPACVSDYDTYANWALYNYPELLINQPLYNKALKRTALEDEGTLILKYGHKYKSLSFHSYLNEK